MKKINPHYQSLYNYNIDQNEDQITITIKVPEGFDTNTISIKCENTDYQKYALTVNIPNELPFICGSLYSEIFPESVKTSIDTKKSKDKNEIYYNIAFQKRIKLTWPTLITDKHPIRDEIDPMSSYLLFTNQSKSATEEDKINEQENIIYAVECGLPIATRTYSKLLYENNEKEKAIDLLKSTVSEYNDLDAMCQLGRFLFFWKEETKKEGLNFLKRASKLGKKEVNGLIGQILSPFSDYKYENKDPKAAVHYLKLALETSNEDDYEDCANVEIDIEIIEEEEDKSDDKETVDDTDDDDKQRNVYMKELQKIIDSGVIEVIEKKTKQRIIFACSSILLVVGVALVIHFRRKSKK